MRDGEPKPSTGSRVLDVASFLLWHDPDHLQGGVTAEQAFDSFCELLSLPKGTITNIVRGKPDQDPRP